MKKLRIEVDVKPQAYDLFIGSGLFPDIASYVQEEKLGNRFAIISDTTVNPLHGAGLLAAFQACGLDAQIFTFPAGEAYKNRQTKLQLEDHLLENRYGRDGAIVALGGGVVGDIAGFVAATYMRGIPCIQVPTTIISQADSSIGGKTAVDVPQGKNLIGAFHHPCAVFIDVDTLKTLDLRNYRSGMLEIIKHGIIRDVQLFDFIVHKRESILDVASSGYNDVMCELMTRNCKVKNDVVAMDTRESNLRKILNYGHTIGHAVEHLSGYKLLHGEALAIGVAVEAYFSYRQNFCSREDYEKQVALMRRMELEVKIPREMKVDQIMDILKYDKKARNSIPEFVQIEAIGKIKLFAGERTTTVIPEKQLRTLLQEYRELS